MLGFGGGSDGGTWGGVVGRGGGSRGVGELAAEVGEGGGHV